MRVEVALPTAVDLAPLARMSETQAQARIDSGATFVCAYETDKLVGVTWFIGDGVDFWVLANRVDDLYQGQGIGTKIRLAAIEECKNQGTGKGRIYGFVVDATKPFWEGVPGFRISAKHQVGYRNINIRSSQ